MSGPEDKAASTSPSGPKIVLAAFVVLGLGVMGTYLNRPAEKTESSPVLQPLADLSQDPATAPPMTEVVVHVTGAVKKPQVVRLPLGARVDDAVKLAEPSPNADLDALNLAAKLEDGTAIYVPRKGAIAAAPSQPVARTSPRPRPLTGNVPLEPPIPTDLQKVDSRYLGGRYRTEPDRPKVAAGGSEARASRAAETPKASPGGVSLNQATAEQLDTLPGVGPSTVAAILEYRSQRGGFSSIDELLEVKGIGPKKLEKMRPFLRL